MGPFKSCDRQETFIFFVYKPHPIPDSWIAVSKKLNEEPRHGKLHVRHEEGEGDGSRPPVRHLHQPVHPLHARVRPYAHLRTIPSSKFRQQMALKHDCSSKFNPKMALKHDYISKFKKQMERKHGRSSKFNQQMKQKHDCTVVQN
jgi:hypothetical protein